MDGEDQRRTAANEAMFRDVTEAIERGQWPGEDDEPGFRCECARLGCNQVIALTLPEYERVRAHSRRFVVAPGHELPEAETISEEQPVTSSSRNATKPGRSQRRPTLEADRWM
jgi:hypothetical protein